MWKHLSSSAGISRANSKASSNMNRPKSKCPVYQQKYRKKIEQTNKVNAEFMQYASEHAPWIFQRFFEEKAVIFTKIYYLPSCVKTQIVLTP